MAPRRRGARGRADLLAQSLLPAIAYKAAYIVARGSARPARPAVLRVCRLTPALRLYGGSRTWPFALPRARDALAHASWRR